MGKESAMKIREVQDRTAPLMTALLAVWEKSVRTTHTFLSEEEIEHIKTYVPTAFHSVQHLLTAETASGEPVAFMGITGDRLEMLFLLPDVRGQGLGRQLLEYAIRNYGVGEVTVNEQNPQAVGFYQHLGFVIYRRTSHDAEGNPYPLLYLKLPQA